jgi:hypothetical protein
MSRVPLTRRTGRRREWWIGEQRQHRDRIVECDANDSSEGDCDLAGVVEDEP